MSDGPFTSAKELAEHWIAKCNAAEARVVASLKARLAIMETDGA